MIILRNKQFSPTTRDAKEELLKYIEGDKLVDFSKISIEDAKELKKMLISLNHGAYDFMKGKAKPYVPENVEGIFDKLGMEKTRDGIREMIHKSTNPEILKRIYDENRSKDRRIFKQFDYDEKENKKIKLNSSAKNKALVFADHNTPHKQDNGNEMSWYNKNVALKDKDGKLRKIQIVDDTEISGGGGLEINARTGQTEGIILGRKSKTRPGLIGHEAGHEQGSDSNGVRSDIEESLIKKNVGGGIGEEILASTRADKAMKEMGKSKEEIRQGNKMNGLALTSYLPFLLDSPMSDYLIDKTHLAKKIKKL